MRDVPDNQEVFAHSKSDQSLIFDILQYEKDVTDEEAAEYEFLDICLIFKHFSDFFQIQDIISKI